MNRAFGWIVHPRVAVILHDLFMVWLAWTGMLFLRYSFVPYLYEVPLFGLETGLVLASQALVFWWTGLYKGVWRFASMPDMLNIIRASVGGALLISAVLFLFTRLEGIPRSGLFIYPVLLAILLATPRLAYRLWKDWRLSTFPASRKERILILGAGRAGELLARDMRREGIYQPVGFLDDQARLKGSRIHGIPVLGGLDRLNRAAVDTAADLVVIAIPSATSAEMHRVVSACEKSELPFRTLPRLQDMLSGAAPVNQLREVAIEDLLGREAVHLDWREISTATTGKRVLVTGGGGSIGAELCRQLARLDPEKLIILENSEFNLYRIGREIRTRFPDLVLETVLGDVCDHALVEHTLGRNRPEIVLHAAAYKQVPLLEGHAREAVRNNALGTEVLARAADQHGVNIFVLISTDKAVHPANVMGATKRLAELFCQHIAANSDTRFVTVRFGNVLDSAGSVLPVFREQIRTGGPVTVTHPEVSRFFMTIPESCQLILQAAVLGKGGEIFVLDMGEPVRVKFLAEQMIRLAGSRAREDIQIVYTGLRSGEKLVEELFYEYENNAPTRHEKILLARNGAAESPDMEAVFRRLRRASLQFDEDSLQAVMDEMLPGMRETDGESSVVSIVHRPQRRKA